MIFPIICPFCNKHCEIENSDILGSGSKNIRCGNCILKYSNSRYNIYELKNHIAYNIIVKINNLHYTMYSTNNYPKIRIYNDYYQMIYENYHYVQLDLNNIEKFVINYITKILKLKNFS